MYRKTVAPDADEVDAVVRGASGKSDKARGVYAEVGVRAARRVSCSPSRARRHWHGM